MDTEGMVAMVRALPNASLTVSLMDGTRQYTLVPASGNLGGGSSSHVQAGSSSRPVRTVATEPCDHKGHAGHHCDSASQAVDGRYASVYQISHCSVRPTSPPVLLTEFPPQRPELTRGHGNFVVGGLGSGERSYDTTTKMSQSYRGSMNWSDRSVYTPRPCHHHEADPFAHSLRKYPNLSPERSSEVIERLVNYTAARNSCSSTKNVTKGSVSPTRPEAVPSPWPGSEGRYYVTASLQATRLHETEGGTKEKTADDSASRDNEGYLDGEEPDLRRSVFQRIYDVRPVRETRKARETLGNMTAYSKSHMETQAKIPMVSKEVTTTPRERPLTCNVAVPLSPSASNFNFTDDPGSSRRPDYSQHHQPQSYVTDSIKEDSFSHKSIQTANITDLAIRHLKKSVQTCISSVDIHQSDKMRVKSCRKTKSQEEIRESFDMDKELLNIIKELTFHPDNKTSFCVRNGLLKKLKKTYKLDRSDRLRWKLGRCRRDHLCYRADCKHFKKDLSNELFYKVKASNIILKCCSIEKLSAEDVQCTRNNSDNDNRYVELIKEWLHEISVKAVDYLGNPVKKEQVLHVVASKIKSLIINKVQYERFDSLKSEILNILDDVPIEVSTRNKTRYLNRIAHGITKNLGEVFTVNFLDRKRWEKSIDLDKTLKNTARKDAIIFNYQLPPDNDLKKFIDQELKDFTAKFNVKICRSTEEEIQTELIDILIDSFNDLRYGKEEKIKEEILLMISEFICLSEYEGIYFANNIIYNLKDFLKEIHLNNTVTSTFVVLQNTTQNFSNQTAASSKKDITDQDINKNIDKYTEQIVQQINIWMENISGLKTVDGSFKRVVAYDLAGDIVDRHKYLELNPSTKSTDANELEHLKYQIFKWVNKLVGENNVEAIDQASQLMDQIQNILVPIFTKPDHNVNKSKSVSFKEDEGSTKGDKPNERKRLCSLGEETPKSSSLNHDYPKSISFKEPENNNHEANALTNTEKNRAYPNQTGLGTQLDAKKRNVCTETDMPQVPKMRPRSTSMTDMGYSKAASTASQSDQGKRYSSPPGFCLECPNARLDKDMEKPPKFYEQKSSRPPNSDRLISHGCNLDNTNEKTAINQLKDEYDKYLQTWVQQIPITLSKPEEQGQIDTMRKRVYHGVWKAITKLQMNPNTLSNLFHYQDVLDDELEELLDTLPQSRELINKKQIMKNQLIKKTADTHVQIFELVSGTSYKQQLVDTVATHMPRKSVGFTGFDVHNICEDIHKLNLAETFLMYTMYDRDIDIVKANVFKKKLMKQIQELFDELKRTRGVDMADIDFKTYKDDILKDLVKVHPPTDQTIREEADEVLIGLEIEQWFQDLPLYETDNNFEILCRKRYRDSLAQKVHEMEKDGKLVNCEDKLRHEITRFMTKLPIRENEIENIPFMIEELVNRLKNRSENRSLVAEPVNRLTNLVHPHDYDDFSRNMPHCSSFTNGASAGHAQLNESSYYIRDGEKVEGPDHQSQVQGRDSSSMSKQWYSLKEDGAHKSIEQPLQNHIHDEQAQNISALPQQQFSADGEKGNCQSTQSSQGLDCFRPICNIGDARLQDSRNSSQKGQENMSRANDSVNKSYCLNQKSLLTGTSRLSGKNAANCKKKSKPSYTGHTSLPIERHLASHMPRLLEGQVSDETNLSNHRHPRSSPQDQYPEDTTNTPDAFPINTPIGFSENQPIFQENLPHASFNPAEYCIKPNQNRICSRPLPSRPPDDMSGYPMNTWQGRSTDACEPETLSRPIPSTSGQSSGGTIPKDYCRQPFATTSPQNDASATRESRTKKRSTESGRSRRATARNKYVSDSDDSVREEVKCQCIERMLRNRKNRAMTMPPPCSECDIEYPLCVPLRFCPYPYFYY